MSLTGATQRAFSTISAPVTSALAETRDSRERDSSGRLLAGASCMGAAGRAGPRRLESGTIRSARHPRRRRCHRTAADVGDGLSGRGHRCRRRPVDVAGQACRPRPRIRSTGVALRGRPSRDRSRRGRRRRGRRSRRRRRPFRRVGRRPPPDVRRSRRRHRVELRACHGRCRRGPAGLARPENRGRRVGRPLLGDRTGHELRLCSHRSSTAR